MLIWSSLCSFLDYVSSTLWHGVMLVISHRSSLTEMKNYINDVTVLDDFFSYVICTTALSIFKIFNISPSSKLSERIGSSDVLLRNPEGNTKRFLKLLYLRPAPTCLFLAPSWLIDGVACWWDVGSFALLLGFTHIPLVALDMLCRGLLSLTVDFHLSVYYTLSFALMWLFVCSPVLAAETLSSPLTISFLSLFLFGKSLADISMLGFASISVLNHH